MNNITVIHANKGIILHDRKKCYDRWWHIKRNTALFYDEAAKQYLLLVYKQTMQGDIKEAMYQAKRLMDTLVCDENLFGCIDIIPGQLPNSDNWATNFLAALLCLYSTKYEQALLYVEKVLNTHQCQEALYLKSRALAA